jgi:hypothetical protein
MAKLALAPGWSAGHGSKLGVGGGGQGMALPAPPYFLLFGQLWARKAAGTIFSWSVPWQEGRAEKHGAGRGAGQGEGKQAGRGLRRVWGAADRARKHGGQE